MTDEQMVKHLDQCPDVAVTVEGHDYRYNGWLVAIFKKRSNGWRCVVEDKHGRLAFHASSQLSVPIGGKR